MIRIKQIKTSHSLRFFAHKMIKKFSLEDYYDPSKPCLFFGLYRQEDYESLLQHKSQTSVLWGGSDALMIDNFKQHLPVLRSVRNIASSSFISNTLKMYQIPHETLPVTPAEIVKQKKPRGENIHFYTSLINGEKYGEHIVNEIKNIIPYKIITTHYNKYSESELEKIYESCFIGLRLTLHDGCSNTVCELGLRGRRCIHNGKIPNAIPYKDTEEIIKIINEEYKMKGEDNEDIVNSVYDYLNIGDKWLDVNY